MTGKNLGKNIAVRSEVSGLDQVQQLGTAVNKLPNAITITAPPVSQWTKLKDEVRHLYSGMTDLASGVKNLGANFLSHGGGVLVLVEGFKSLIKIGQHFYGEWINGMKEAAAMSEQNAEC